MKDKFYEIRLKNLIKDISNISKYPNFTPNMKPNFWKNDLIKILRQEFSSFIVDYGLFETEIYYKLKYSIEQL